MGIAGLLIVAACKSSRDLPTVESVNLDRYAGTWYDIAHLPQDYLEDCDCVTAEYIKRENDVKVVNSCIDVEDGELNRVEGKAVPIEGSGNSRMEVEFFFPFEGDYYIIALQEDYSYAMVGSPDRESLWILSRRPQPAAIVLKQYLNRAEELGFDTSRLVYTDQSCHAEPIEQAP